MSYLLDAMQLLGICYSSGKTASAEYYRQVAANPPFSASKEQEMTETELKHIYTVAYRILRAERRMRLFVYRDRPQQLKQKIAEMDEVLRILGIMKDELKRHVTESSEQPRLLDVPRREQYG